MKGDFTRNSFVPRKHYSSVRLQQGRVGPLDAEWNEQIDIDAHLVRTTDKDVIGLCGSPKGEAGFEIAAAGQDLTISAGRYYVHGILVENEAEVAITKQEDLPDYDPLNDENLAAGTYLAYLDVWERHITALDDDAIREVALGGPDTTTRTRVIWQVKLDPVDDTGAAIDCGRLGDWTPTGAAIAGKLAARAEPAGDEEGPCIVPPGAGYRRLENQLYRVEIHQSGRIDAATFKWSRENGSVVTRWEAQDANNLTVSSAGRDRVLGFATGDWVELTDDTRELKGKPGVLVRLNRVEGNVLSIDPATIQDPTNPTATTVDRNAFPRNPKIRRWESEGAQAVTIPATGDGWIPLEDGVQIKFGAGDFRSGDYWLIPARTAMHDVLWPKDGAGQPVFENCQGIRHYYAPLALVALESADGGAGWKVLDKCRDLFPPLTDISAKDVNYDGANCDAIQATNVQEAIDQICQARDLRHHNMHLHGWGIVCGLQVHCGENRNEVVVHPGYAIDCKGNDIIILKEDGPMPVHVMDMIKEWNNNKDKSPLLTNGADGGEGTICLVLDRDEHGRAVVNLSPLPEDNSIQALMQGTLLMDFLQQDILKPLEGIRNALFRSDGNGGRALVGSGRRQSIALVNLLVQLWSPMTGSHVYLSEKEHVILAQLHSKVQTILKSKTFCAMFEDERQFPGYPFPNAKMSTIFDRNTRTRLRIHPTRNLGYAVGDDNKIHVYRLAANDPQKPSERDGEEEELIGVLEMPGTGLVAKDVAFSENGEQLYAVGVVNDKHSVFAVADIKDDCAHEWVRQDDLCDVQLVTLATAPSRNALVYAIGPGKGLFRIDVRERAQMISDQPMSPFNAYGHLLIDDQGQSAFATAYSGKNGIPPYYDQVIEIPLNGGKSRYYEMKAGRTTYTGQDDIALVPGARSSGLKLYVVAKPTDSGGKGLLVFLTAAEQDPKFISLIDDTLHLAYLSAPSEGNKARYLLVTGEEANAMGLVDVQRDRAVDLGTYFLPTQIDPVAIAVSPTTQRAYVVNNLSATITSIAGEHLKPTPPAEGQLAPGSAAFLQEMIEYRRAIFNAFLNLTGGVLQYLKDSFCDRLLVDCPTCDKDDEKDDKVYLGCVEIRNNEVYRVCNFSKRKYVKSFPTIDYWLSVIPVAPLVDWVVEQFCCLVLPSLFGKLKAPQQATRTAQITNEQLRGVSANFQQKRYQQPIADLRLRANALQSAVGKGLDDLLKRAAYHPSWVPPIPPEQAVRLDKVIDQPVEDATQVLSSAKIHVISTASYDSARTVENLVRVGTAPLRIPQGSHVTLFEEDGVVRSYKLAAQPVPEVKAVVQEPVVQSIESRDFQALQETLSALQSQMAEKDHLLTELQKKVDALAPAEPLGAMQTQLEDLREQVESLQRHMPG